MRRGAAALTGRTAARTADPCPADLAADPPGPAPAAPAAAAAPSAAAPVGASPSAAAAAPARAP